MTVPTSGPQGFPNCWLRDRALLARPTLYGHCAQGHADVTLMSTPGCNYSFRAPWMAVLHTQKIEDEQAVVVTHGNTVSCLLTYFT